jgi:microcystin-dependent protein
MSEPFVGEIRMFTGNYAPRGWAMCNGQIMPIAQNTALFSLLGIMYGGDGRSTFALPNLQARMPMGSGDAPGLTPRSQGDTGGEAAHTLTVAEIPAHAHAVHSAAAPDSVRPSATALLAHSGDNASLFHAPTQLTPMAASAVGPTGGSWAHNNQPPVLCLNFIIALQGVFPPRS